jgi:hypothetical protein
MSYRLCLLTSAFFLAVPLAFAQEDARPSFQDLLDRARRMDPKADFKALRLAYAETPAYNPYASTSEIQAAILKAMREKDYPACLTHVDRALQKNYLDINVHFAAYRAHTELKNTDKARYHHFFMDRLIRSILASGDGKAIATAYLVISTEEEYAILDAVGLRRVSQSLVKDNDHTYDLMIARDEKENRELKIYFNVDRQFDWLRKKLEERRK